MLGRRELSEAQVRQRLARREHDPEAIDEAVARLIDERAIDDNRVARGDRPHGNGHPQARQAPRPAQDRSAGISPAIARRALDEVFGRSTTTPCSSPRSPNGCRARRRHRRRS